MKDLSSMHISQQAKRARVVLPADLFLYITEAPREVYEDKSKLLVPIAVGAGVLLSILLFAPFFVSVPYPFILATILVFGAGVYFGWTSHIHIKERKEVLFNYFDVALNKLKNRFLDE